MKTKLLFITAALLGALAIVWMGLGFVGGNPLALLVTVIIGFVYALGLVELTGFRRATGELARALGQVRAGDDFDLPPWLGTLPASLRNAVNQRIEGEKTGLPAPVFTPYLVGLLVMLGLLGTFIGMVDTLQGAVSALQGSSELAAIRAGLAAPIEGLSLAFGTSVAGIAASAMLGLNATLSRRERMLVTRELDRHIAGPLRRYSLHYNRQQTYLAMQGQAQALPEVARTLGNMAGELERMGQQLSSQLLDNQQQFHQQTGQQYQQLASSVEQSLQQTLGESGRLAGESIAPAVEGAMAALSAQAGETQQKLLEVTENLLHSRAASEADWLAEQGKRLQAITTALREDMAGLTAALRDELGQLRQEEAEREEKIARRLADIQDGSARQLQSLQDDSREQLGQAQAATAQALARLQDSTAEQLQQLQQATAGQLAGTQTDTAERLAAIHSDTSSKISELHSAASTGLEQLQAAAAQSLQQLKGTVSDGVASLQTRTADSLGALEKTAAEQLAGLGRELQQPMRELIATASETPRAAAEVIGKLREEVSNSMERDNQLLAERQRILEDLGALATDLRQSSAAQQAAIEQLVNSSGELMAGVSSRFQAQLESESDKLAEITANAAGSAADIASLGESFSLAVQLFSESNQQLMENLGRIEESMDKTTERSDEQMGYYVAQAREIIDQSMLSQREIIEELRRLGQTGDLFAAEAG
ncbi:DUF802 domain-containing protein [Seongchinamella sediminis]|uniref:DUF802 domain-containing protein n=1 Tax=Seongchinamella sediminis TaxID=2283635 RepID=A0A3L7DYZ9_9GAMM|nr:DUF802 domain-containing protein [Seongchinamella sediminis]RLQ21885.1 DUF802 domain-containing protein [Seongchinamella sediminis]